MFDTRLMCILQVYGDYAIQWETEVKYVFDHYALTVSNIELQFTGKEILSW